MVGILIEQKETIIPRGVQGQQIHLIYFLLEKGGIRCGLSMENISFLKAETLSISSTSAWHALGTW